MNPCGAVTRPGWQCARPEGHDGNHHGKPYEPEDSAADAGIYRALADTYTDRIKLTRKSLLPCTTCDARLNGLQHAPGTCQSCDAGPYRPYRAVRPYRDGEHRISFFAGDLGDADYEGIAA